MKEIISDKVEVLIEKNIPEDAPINDFIRANEEYKKLLQVGLTTKRGFNIMTTEEIYSPVLNYSCSQSKQ